jgi:uncharacterized metal-binding protein YceD (DUF177 family)
MVSVPLSPSELARMIKVRPLPGEVVVIEADATERAALAHRFGLGAVESLRAEVSLEARSGAIRATGRLRAAIMQACAVSGEDFRVTIDEAIDLRFVAQSPRPATEDKEIEIALEADDCDEIEYAGDMFDLGEAVAQTLGLAIDPYAKGPNADAARKAAGIIPEGEQQGPLAAMLAALKKD